MSDHPGYPPQPSVPPRRPRRWPWITGAAIAVLVVAGSVSYALNPSSARAASVRTITRTVTVTLPAPPALTVIETVTVTQPPQTITVSATPAPGDEISADGVYAVGQDIKAGTWHTTGGAECYYARLHGTDTESIIDNNNINGPATVTVRSSDGAFQISGGCTWTRNG